MSQLNEFAVTPSKKRLLAYALRNLEKTHTVEEIGAAVGWSKTRAHQVLGSIRVDIRGN